MIILFLILTFLSAPSIFYFFTSKSNTSFFRQLELGNLGFASALCEDVPLGVGKLSLDCPSGIITEIVDFGIIPHNAKVIDTCLSNIETKTCDSLLK